MAKKARPHVIINFAMSADGKMARPSGEQARISCEDDLARVHRMRSASDAILVGIGTVLSDDPKLTVKEKYVKRGKNPLRVVLDSKCRTPNGSHVASGEAKTIIFTADGRARKAGFAKVIECGKGRVDVAKALAYLYRMGVRSIMVEGGGTVIGEFLRLGLVDEMYIYIGSMALGGAVSPAREIQRDAGRFDPIGLRLVGAKKVGKGALLHYMVDAPKKQ